MKKRIMSLLLCALLLSGCGGKAAPTETAPQGPDWASLAPTGTMPLEYATQFQVAYYPENLALITIGGDTRYLLIPEGGAVPANLDKDITVLQQPLDQIYLASTSAMDLYRAADGLDALAFSSLEASGWYIPEAKAAVERGDIRYAGKYSAPDYELLYSSHCDLAVENTMIYHTPEVKEQLERLGIPVLVERSSYEKHPLGRMEWMKLHALLVGKLDTAVERYQQELDALQDVLGQTSTGKTVAFFNISASGYVTVRKPGDYIAKMIGLAGGKYVFDQLGEDDKNTSTINLQMEAFYDQAKDADILIYNSTLGGELHTMEELLSQSSLLSQFKAVKNGQVWCTGQNVFQETMGLGGLILDMNRVFTGQQAGTRYLHQLTQ